MSYSPNWSPGDLLEKDEIISRSEKLAIVKAAKGAGNWTQADEDAFWSDDQPT